MPLDTAETNNGLPSLRINNAGNNWWAAILAGPSWERYSIAPYVVTLVAACVLMIAAVMLRRSR